MLHNFIKSKNSCVLSKEVERLQKELGCVYSGKSWTKPSEVFKSEMFKEQQNAAFLEMSMLPGGIQEFKNSQFYTLPSILKKYQGFCPGAQPLINGSNTSLE